MKRAVIASLWFFVAFCMHELAWSLAGSPRVLGLVLGVAAAAFVLIDPIQMLARTATVEPKRGAQRGRRQVVGR